MAGSETTGTRPFPPRPKARAAGVSLSKTTTPAAFIRACSSGDARWSNAVNWSGNIEPYPGTSANFLAGFPNGDWNIIMGVGEAAFLVGPFLLATRSPPGTIESGGKMHPSGLPDCPFRALQSLLMHDLASRRSLALR